MILDVDAEFADAVDVVTSGTSTDLIGNVIDLETVRDIGQGKQSAYLVIQVSTAFAGGTSMQFILASDAQAAIATDGNETRHLLTDVYADADLIAGFQQSFQLPSGDVANSVVPYERYLGILGVGVGTHSAGAINAFITLDPPSNQRAYPDATN